MANNDEKLKRNYGSGGQLTTLIGMSLIGLFCILRIPTEAIAGSQVTPPHPPFKTGTMLRRVITHNRIEREYFVYIPTTTAGQPAIPVVIALHGYGGTATGFQTYHDLNRHAEKHSYMLVYPQGTYFRGTEQIPHVTSWNDKAANLSPHHCTPTATTYPCPPECGSCGPCDWTSCYDDVGFIRAVLDLIAIEFPTDLTRYYVMGVSNGGMMTLRLGCEMSATFAAIAPIIGQLAPGFACAPRTSLPMLHLFGGKDQTVPHDGSLASDGYRYTSAHETARVWATSMACQTGPVKWQNSISQAAGLICTAYTNCRMAGHEVVSCMAPEGDHRWPHQRLEGATATCVTRDQSASLPHVPRCKPVANLSTQLGMDLVWAFLSRYQRLTPP